MVMGHRERLWCATCRLVISWRPVWHDGRAYCCQGCAAGGPCTCSYDLAADDEAADGQAGGEPVVAPGAWDTQRCGEGR